MQFQAIAAFVCCSALVAAAAPQQQQQEQRQLGETEKPVVAILKQINKINPDGSYTYGFEAADGSFRVETRDIRGNVRGTYGYVDETGQLKSVEYEAGEPQGFRPRGQHLPVVPRPTSSAQNDAAGVDDEFGTDEDWQSVDADEDGEPDPPRPLSQRHQEATRKPEADRPFFLPARQQAAVPTIFPQRFDGPLFPFQFASAPVQRPLVPVSFAPSSVAQQ